MEGVLKKKGGIGSLQWQERNFKLNGKNFLWKIPGNDTVVKGLIALTPQHKVEVTPGSLEFSLAGPGQKKVYTLQAANATDLADWTSALKSAIASASPSPSPPLKGDGVANGNGVAAPSPSAVGGSVSNGAAPTTASASPGASVKPRTVSLADLEVVGTLGRGSYGKIAKVLVKNAGLDADGKPVHYAMWSVDASPSGSGRKLEEWMTLLRLSHPFVLKFHYVFVESDRIYIVHDIVPGGDLFTHLRSEAPFKHERTLLYTAELVLALSYLHENGVVFRDLKPETVSLDAQGHVVLSDFGGAIFTSNAVKSHSFCGTPEYLPPETLTEEEEGQGVHKFVPATDWWSLGVVMYEMLVGLTPFYASSPDEILELITNKTVTFPGGLSIPSDTQDLILAWLCRDMQRRLCDPADIKKHPAFDGIDWASVASRSIVPSFIPTPDS